MLELKNVVVKYGNAILALDDVSLKVGEKKIVGLFGANGAGKTTVLRAISGLLRSEEGEIIKGTINFNKKRIEKTKAEDIVRMGIVQVIEGRRIFGKLSVNENLIAGGYIRKSKINVKHDLEMIFNEYFPILKRLRDRTSGYLSGGEQQMLVIARALMAKPKLILLDEPSMGLAPMIIKNIFEIILQIKEKEASSILLVEQNVKAGLSISDYGYILENGKMVLEGKKEDLMFNKDIGRYYLHGET
jgi:branched-chain amino acid transport system ATP-binding protein